MPAKKYVEEFPYDATTFNFEQFKAGLLAEITQDDDLSSTKITALEGERDTLTQSERDLKVRLFDATVKRQGAPVTPQDSPTNGVGDDQKPTVSESDIWGEPEQIRS